MKEILYNLALIDTLNFCKEQNIDCSGTHLVKSGRGFTYGLIRTEENKPLVSVTFHKRSVPTHLVYTTEVQND